VNRISFVVIALALAACGKQSTALERNRAGTGSGTLLVDASIDASTTSGALTSFQVDLQDGLGANVSGATVTIHNAEFGDVPLVEASAGSGKYVNSKAAISNADFGLDVSHPTGAVTGVVVGNPGMHVINAPQASGTVPAGALQVSWTTPTTAYSAAVETRDFGPAAAPDTGTYTIAAASNPPNSTQRLDVDRYNVVNIAGGLVGSQMTVTSKVRVSYVQQ
jgi:hypothetical protein